MELYVENQWMHEGKLFDQAAADEKIAEGFIGFIYEITDNLTSRKYIGKKLLVGKRKLPPLKGKKRKRTKIVESDWMNYFGSSELVQELVAERQVDFSREILFFCKSKGEMSYVETREHFFREVLLNDKYMNNFISCKINGNTIKAIKEGLRKNINQ